MLGGSVLLAACVLPFVADPYVLEVATMALPFGGQAGAAIAMVPLVPASEGPASAGDHFSPQLSVIATAPAVPISVMLRMWSLQLPEAGLWRLSSACRYGQAYH